MGTKKEKPTENEKNRELHKMTAKMLDNIAIGFERDYQVKITHNYQSAENKDLSKTDEEEK